MAQATQRAVHGRSGRPGRVRAQMSLMALAALGLVVIVVVYLFLARGRVGSEVEVSEIRSAAVKDALLKLDARLESSLMEASYRAVDEMGEHGGFTAENVPSPNHLRVPFWFFRGSPTNVPSVGAMERMLADEVRRRMEPQLARMAKDLGPSFSLGEPKYTAALHDSSIDVSLDIAVGVTEERSTARTSITKKAELPLRLKRLRDIAEAYVRDYEQRRPVEGVLLNSIKNDPRIPAPPGGSLETGTCEVSVLKHREELVEPFRHNAKLAAAIELNRARKSSDRSDLVGWSSSADLQSLSLSFVANTDLGEPSSEVIREYPLPFFPGKYGTTCLRAYTVAYNVSFPITIRLRDLQRTSKVVGAEGVSEVKPLELVFAVEPLLVGEDRGAKDASVSAPKALDDLCQGSCSLEVRVTNIREGRVWLDSCEYPYPTPSRDGLYVGNAACDVHTLVIEATDPRDKARHVEQVNVVERYSLEVALSDRAEVRGRAMMENTVLCTASHQVKDGGKVPLGYVEGNPPTYVEVQLYPLDPRLGPSQRAVADDSGRFSIPDLNPGRYLVLLLPSEDSAGVPGYKVLPAGRIVAVKGGANELGEVALRPLAVEFVGGKYVNVASREVC